jgi:CelD/BcsL family acetyltransferase involved in cellulose biosynthesis
MEAFIVSASAQVTRNGKFIFFAITLDDEIIAALIVVECTYRLLAFQVAHAPGFEKYGLGFLIIRHVLHYAFDRQLTVELGCGNTQFKKSISSGSDAVAMRVYATSVWGSARMALRRYREWRGRRREMQKISTPTGES